MLHLIIFLSRACILSSFVYQQYQMHLHVRHYSHWNIFWCIRSKATHFLCHFYPETRRKYLCCNMSQVKISWVSLKSREGNWSTTVKRSLVKWTLAHTPTFYYYQEHVISEKPQKTSVQHILTLNSTPLHWYLQLIF